MMFKKIYPPVLKIGDNWIMSDLYLSVKHKYIFINQIYTSNSF